MMGSPALAGAGIALAAVAVGALVEVVRLRARHRAHATDGRVFLHVTFEVKPANEAAFFDAFRPLLAASQAEPGCLKYQLTSELEGAPHTYVLIEEWASAEALARHETLPHFTSHVPRLAGSAKITVHKYATVDVGPAR